MKLNEHFLTKQSCAKNINLLSIKLLCLKDIVVDRLLLYPMYCFCQTLCKLLLESHKTKNIVFPAL